MVLMSDWNIPRKTMMGVPVFLNHSKIFSLDSANLSKTNDKYSIGFSNFVFFLVENLPGTVIYSKTRGCLDLIKISFMQFFHAV